MLYSVHYAVTAMLNVRTYTLRIVKTHTATILNLNWKSIKENIKMHLAITKAIKLAKEILFHIHYSSFLYTIVQYTIFVFV